MSFLHRLSTKILVFMLAGIVMLTAVFFYTSRVVVISVYRAFFSDKTVMVNSFIASQIGGDDLSRYVEALKGDAEFRQDQLAFHQARQRLFELEGEPDSEESELLWEQIRLFYRKNGKFKDENYARIQEQLEALRTSTGATYLYIFADTGLPGFLTYIVDAHPAGEEASNLDMDDIGAVGPLEDFLGSETALAAQPQEENAYYGLDTHYGEMYSSYSPIFDSKGSLVAVIGTDIDVSEMNRRIGEMERVQMWTALAGLSLFILVSYLIMRRAVVKPIEVLTETAASIADGHIYAALPSWLLRKNDEMGRLGKALSFMTGVFQKFLTEADHIFDAAMTGRLGARIDPSNFEGDFALFARQINDTLDIIEMYFDSIPEAVFILDVDLKLTFRNIRYANLFGYMPVKELVRKILWGSEPNEDGDDALCTKWNRSVAGGAYTTSVRLAMPYGAENWFTFTCCDLVLNEVKRGTVVIADDITNLMAEKTKAQNASKAKGEFLSRVSHELRSPMNVIVGMAKLGLKNAGEKSRGRFESIVSASGHLLGIINDVLDMSSIESGKLEIRYAQFNLHGLISDCVSLLKQQSEEKNLELYADIGPEVASEAVGDSMRLSQVLVNLLTNSIKFTEDGGRVALSARTVTHDGENELVRFTVEDNGIGMSETFLQKIFTPFEQEDMYIQRRYKGTGLGLSICHRLVALMGGKLEVESKLGEGSRFTFTLPFLRAEAGASDTPDADAERSYDFSSIHLLMADDIDINRLILIESLADTKINVTEAADGTEALKIFEGSDEGHFDVIFMDVQMPNMDGYQATKAIRALPRKDAGLPIIAMTANALTEDVGHALASGMSGHISKPVDLKACLRILAKIAEAKRAEKED